MADNILQKKQGGISLVDSSLIALSKSVVVDGVISPVLSNFTKGNPLINGVAKVITAGLIGSAMKSKAGGIVSTSLMVSAGDDVIGSFIGRQASPVNQGASTAGDDSFGQSNKTPSQEVFI